MNKFCIVLLFLLCCLGCSTNKPTLSTENIGFATATPTGETTQSEVPTYKLAVIKKVTEDMITAKGEKATAPPKIILAASKKYVAWMNRKEVGMEETAYDLCTTFGADSLNCMAALMGHELSHFYQNHHVDRSFEFSYLNRIYKASAEQIIKDRIHAKKEAEADYLGGFLAFNAGYYPFKILETLLPSVYQAYQLKDTLIGYPPLQERIKNARASSKKAYELTTVFETANALLALEQYETAITSYEYILSQNYTSREIHNNIGVCYFMMALQQFPEPIKYVYPIEIDGAGRWSSLSKGDEKSIAAAKELVTKAIEKFEIAFTLDPSFATALLNQASAYSLLEATRKAAFYLFEAIDLAKAQHQNKVVTDGYILEAILAIQKGEEATARKNFDLAIAQGSALAQLNKSILDNGELPSSNQKTKEEVGMELIANQNLNQLLRQSNASETSIAINKKFSIYTKQLEDSQLTYFKIDKGRKIVLIHTTLPTYKGKTLKGIQLKDSLKKVLEQYGTPDRIVSQRQREQLLYESSNIIFTFFKGKLQSWSVYKL